MSVKKIIPPPVRETFFYGKIISWDFNDSIVFVKARKNYAYRVRLTFESGNKTEFQKSGFSSKKLASKAKETAIAQLHNGTFVPYDYTAKEFYDYWLYYYMIKEKDISYNTFMSYRNIIYNYFLKVIGDTYLLDLDFDLLTKCLSLIKAPSILRLAYGVMKGSLDYAERNGYIRNNYAASVISNFKTKNKKHDSRNQRISFNQKLKDQEAVYTEDQLSTLLYTCKTEEPKIYLALLLSLTTGLRISETIAVKYDDLDIPQKKLYIKKQLGRSLSNEGVEGESILTQEKRLKTHNSERAVNIVDFVMEEIFVQRKKYFDLKEELGEEFHDLGYIICQDNGLPYNRSFKDKAFKRVVEKCGFGYVPWRKLRNTFASVMKNNNVSLKAISVSLGHYSPDFTEKVYVKSKMQIQDVATLIEDYIKEVLPSQNIVKAVIPDITNDFFNS